MQHWSVISLNYYGCCQIEKSDSAIWQSELLLSRLQLSVSVFKFSNRRRLLIFVSFTPHPHSPTKVVDVIQEPCVSYVYEAIGRTSLTGGGTHSMCYGEITCSSLHSLWLEYVVSDSLSSCLYCTTTILTYYYYYYYLLLHS